jgi:hypothetical protein
MAMRASMYQNRKKERRIQLSMSEEEANALVERDKGTVSAVLTAVKAAIEKGPRAKSEE